MVEVVIVTSPQRLTARRAYRPRSRANLSSRSRQPVPHRRPATAGARRRPQPRTSARGPQHREPFDVPQVGHLPHLLARQVVDAYLRAHVPLRVELEQLDVARPAHMSSRSSRPSQDSSLHDTTVRVASILLTMSARAPDIVSFELKSLRVAALLESALLHATP